MPQGRAGRGLGVGCIWRRCSCTGCPVGWRRNSRASRKRSRRSRCGAGAGDDMHADMQRINAAPASPPIYLPTRPQPHPRAKTATTLVPVSSRSSRTAASAADSPASTSPAGSCRVQKKVESSSCRGSPRLAEQPRHAPRCSVSRAPCGPPPLAAPRGAGGGASKTQASKPGDPPR